MPKEDKVNDSIRLVLHTIDLIFQLKPHFWVMENPRAMLRKIIGYPHYEITQCQYGRPFRKPTDLWGHLPKKFKAKNCKTKDKCHINVSRGENKGVQGNEMCGWDLHHNGKWIRFKDASQYRAEIPYGLSLAVCEACEEECEKIK